MRFIDEMENPSNQDILLAISNTCAYRNFLGRPYKREDALLCCCKHITYEGEEVQCYKLYYETTLIGYMYYSLVPANFNLEHDNSRLSCLHYAIAKERETEEPKTKFKTYYVPVHKLN